MGLYNLIFTETQKNIDIESWILSKSKIGANPYKGSIPSRWVFNKAFDLVMEETTIDDRTKQWLLPEFWSVFKTRVQIINQEALSDLLKCINWEWPIFDEWKDAFEKVGCWPKMWQSYSEVYQPLPELHQAVDLALMDVPTEQIRNILKNKQIKISPHPRRWPEFVAVLKNSLSLEELKDKFYDKIQYNEKLHLERRIVGRCRILIHTISNTTYVLARKYQKDQRCQPASKFDPPSASKNDPPPK